MKCLSISALALPWHEWSSWRWPDLLTAVGFPLVIFGLRLAYTHISEIKDTAKSAAEASKNALSAAQSGRDASEASRQAAVAAREGVHAARAAAEEARDAAEAARAAISRTEKKISDQNLLMLISDIQMVVNALDHAATKDEMVRVAGDWIDKASQLQGLLLSSTLGGELIEQLVNRLGPSVAAAGVMKNAIILEGKDLQMAATPLRDDLTEIQAASSRIMGHMRGHILEEQPHA